MARVMVVVIVMMVGLWIVGQATNAKRIMEKRHATLVAMVEVAGK